MRRPFEKVYAVYRYHDGPVSGVADLDGKPHFFEKSWDEDSDDYGTTFSIAPISEDVLKLVIEDWEMWLRCMAAFRGGEMSMEPQSQAPPVLPADQDRYEEIAPLLKEGLSTRGQISWFYPWR